MKTLFLAFPSPQSERKVWFLAFLLIGAGLAVYAGSLNVPFLLDDIPHILENPKIHSLLPLSKFFGASQGRPLVTLSLALNYALGGFDVQGYHVFNTILHLLAGLLLFGIFRRTLCVPPWPEGLRQRALPLSFFAAVLWLLHPLHTQAVTYIIQRAESMMGLFYLLALYSFIRSRDLSQANFWKLLSVTACWLGMVTKQVMVTAPLTILLYDRIFMANSWKEIIHRRKFYYAGLVLTWLLLLKGGLLEVLGLSESSRVAESAGFGLKQVTPFQYFLTQSGVILHYLRLAYWPVGLSFDYSDWPWAQSLTDVALPLFLVMFFLLATAVALWRWPYWGFWGVWFFLILAPTSSFFPLADPAFEYRMYLPLAGVLFLTVTGAYHLTLNRVRGTAGQGNLLKFVSYLLGGTALIAALLLAFLTVFRNQVYASEMRLWEDVLEKRPHNSRAHDLLGITLARQGKINKALEHFNMALRLDPDYAQAHANAAVALATQGRMAEAVKHFERALELKPSSPEVHTNYGAALIRQGHIEEGLRHYHRAIELNPHYAPAYFNLGLFFSAHGKRREAADFFRKTLALRPDYRPAQEQLARMQEDVA